MMGKKYFLLLSALASGLIEGYQQHCAPICSSMENRQRLSGSCMWSSRDKIFTTTKSGMRKQSIVADAAKLKELNTCSSGAQARHILYEALIAPQGMKDGADREVNGVEYAKPLYDSLRIPPGATDKTISDAELALQTGIRGGRYKVTDLIDTNGNSDVDRTSSFLLILFVSSTGIALVSNQVLSELGVPDIARFFIVWISCFASLGFVGAGIVAPEITQRGLVSLQRLVFPSYRRRSVQHEAGHFLLGHLLGFPISGYRANAVKNAVQFYPLADPNVGVQTARALGFDTDAGSGKYSGSDDLPENSIVDESKPFFSDKGRGRSLVQKSVLRNRGSKDQRDEPMLEMPSQLDARKTWPYRGLDRQTLDKLVVISMGGACAEILGFGNAEGAYADLSQLKQLFSNADLPLSEREMENRVRFAIGYGTTQLRRHLGALDALAAAMESNGSVEQCVLALETCQNISGISVFDGRTRQERLSSSSMIEKLIMKRNNFSRVVDDRKEGRGDGEKRLTSFDLIGDEPLYAALTAATVFLLWAIGGGITLH